jgi:uncharacterized membrane protein
MTERGAKERLADYLRTLAGAVIAFWILSALVALFHVRPVYTLAAFGLFYSLQATYYRFRLSVDAGYRIPDCGCAGRAADGSEIVLRSRESALIGVPNSVLGAVLYPALALLTRAGHTGSALLLAFLALAASAYLARVMITRIGALCFICVNVAALNLLLVWQLVR